MEAVTHYKLKELRVILDSNEVKNYFKTLNVKIKEEVLSDDEPTDFQPISQVYSQEYKIKSEVVDSTRFSGAYYFPSALKSRVPDFYKCEFCNRQFKTPSGLKEHMGSHTLPFKCDICYKTFGVKGSLKSHKLTHYEPQHPCPHCDLKFRQIRKMKLHIERKHCKDDVHECDQSSWKCDKCGKCFKYKDYLRKHIIRMHLTMRNDYICSYCGMKFQADQYLKHHMETQHNIILSSNNSKTCTITTALNELQPNSVKSDAHGSKFQNIYCKQEVPENDGPEISPEIQPISKDNSQEYHEGNIKIEPKSPSDSILPGVTGNFTCNICSEKFTTLDFFKQHLSDRHILNIGGVLKSPNVSDFYKCEFCLRQFKSLSRLKEHMGSHTLPFKCDICEKRCARQTHLKSHKLTHYEPQHPCPHCDLKFRKIRQMKLHIERKHCKDDVHECDQSSWKCVKCGKCFKYKDYLRKHIIRMHLTMRNDYICSYCGMKFQADQYLKHHIETQHNIKLSSNNSKTCTITTALNKLQPNSVKSDAHDSKFLNIYFKQENDEPEISPEIQPISEVYLQEYHEGNITIELKSPSDSTLTDDVENVDEIKPKVIVDERDWSTLEKEESTENEVESSVLDYDLSNNKTSTLMQ